MEWDEELLQLLDIPRAILPEVKQSSEIYGETSTTLFSTKILISGIAGDQHIYKQHYLAMCIKTRNGKNTMEQVVFLLMNTGNSSFLRNNLFTTVA